MKVFGEATLAKFARHHPKSRKPLARFLTISRAASWPHFPAVKESFPATDFTPETGLLIFDIGGNNYRLLARVNFEKQSLLIEKVLTHAEYDREVL